MNGVCLVCWALALGYRAHPTPQPPTPKGQGGLNRGVKRCAVGNARRFIRRSIDPGFIYLESRNPLLDAGTCTSLAQSLDCLGAALIRRMLCGSDWKGFEVQSDDQFPTQSFSGSPLAPGGRGASRSEGERGPPSVLRSTACPGLHPSTSGRGTLRDNRVRGRPSNASSTLHPRPWSLPLERGGWEGVNGPGIPDHQRSTTLPALQARSRPAIEISSGRP